MKNRKGRERESERRGRGRKVSVHEYGLREDYQAKRDGKR
jgi:hypothetical protein